MTQNCHSPWIQNKGNIAENLGTYGGQEQNRNRGA